jgi:hypothetical protein
MLSCWYSGTTILFSSRTGFGPGAGEDLIGGLGWGLAGGVEPEPEPGCLVTEHGVELLDGSMRAVPPSRPDVAR